MDDDGSGILPGSRNHKRAEIMVCACSQPPRAAQLQLPPSPLLLQVTASKDPGANATRRDDVEFDRGSAGDVDLGE